MTLKLNRVEDDDHTTKNGSVFIRHAEATWGERETHRPAGVRGLFANYYVSLCAAVAAMSNTTPVEDPNLETLYRNTHPAMTFSPYGSCIENVTLILEIVEARRNVVWVSLLPYTRFADPIQSCRNLLIMYDQGVVSTILVIPQFLARFTRVLESASGAGF